MKNNQEAPREVPLVETHLHADCAHSPESIHMVSRKYGIEPFKGKTVNEVREMIHPPKGCDWDTWYEHLKLVRKAYISPKVIGELTGDVIKDSAESGVGVLELRISLLSAVQTMLDNLGIKANATEFWRYGREVFAEILRVKNKVTRTLMNTEQALDVSLVMSISCQEKFRSYIPSLLGLCRDYADEIEALDLTNERDTPPSFYAKPIESIRDDIRFLTIHCMEVMGPERGWDALELEPDRIGHGIRAIENRALVEALAEEAIPLEMCVLSNLRTGVVKRPEDHPMRKLHEAGVRLVIGSDGCNDGSTLTDNYRFIEETLGFSQEEMRQFRENSWKCAFENIHCF